MKLFKEFDEDDIFILIKREDPFSSEKLVVENKNEFIIKFKKIKTAIINKNKKDLEEKKVSIKKKASKDEKLESEKKLETKKKIFMPKIDLRKKENEFKNNSLELLKIKWDDYKRNINKSSTLEKIKEFRKKKYEIFKVKIKSKNETDFLDNIKTEKINIEETELFQFEEMNRNNFYEENISLDSNHEDHPFNSYPTTPEESDDFENSSNYCSNKSEDSFSDYEKNNYSKNNKKGFNQNFINNNFDLDCKKYIDIKNIDKKFDENLSEKHLGENNNSNEINKDMYKLMASLELKPKYILEEDERDVFYDHDFDEMEKNLTYHDQGNIEIEY